MYKRQTWERGWSFIKRAGTVILASSVILWFLQGFGFAGGVFGMVEDNNTSLLAWIGQGVAPIFAPLGFGSWKAAVATFTGLIAKEKDVYKRQVVYGPAPGQTAGQMAALLRQAGEVALGPGILVAADHDGALVLSQV